MSIVRAQGELLVVPEGARIPKVCLKCGATKEVVRNEQSYIVSAIGRAGPWVGGAIGAGTASVVRNVFRDDWAMQAIAIGVICVAAAGIGVVVHVGSRKVTLELPLCTEHDAKLAAARRNRVPFVGGAVLALSAMLLGMGMESVAVAALGGVLLVVLIVAARAAKMHEAWVHAAAVTEEHVALRVGEDLARSIAERAEKRAAKKAADAA